MPDHTHDPVASTTELFSTDPAGLPECRRPELVELSDGQVCELEITAVSKQLEDTTVRMLAYNRSIPGPTLKVQQGSEVVVNVTNHGDHVDTVHWHGLRLDNRYDGTHETQAPIPVNGSFSYRLAFPDPGVYWYHPHLREDYGQELGLYGNILVVPREPDYWPPANRELLLTLDDILVEDGQVAPFSRSETTHTAMGRFGNIMLVSGEPQLTFTAQLDEVVRLYLTNTANTRVFNVGLEGARMKLVGADSGRIELEELVERVLLAPSERAVVDVLFDQPGHVVLEHHTPQHSYSLAAIDVTDDPATPSFQQQFAVLRRNADLMAERDRIAPYLAAEPDKTLAFVAEMDMGATEGAVVYTCPMHPHIVRADEGSCPECGMKLLATATTYTCPMHPEVVSDEEGRCPKCGMKLMAAPLVSSTTEHSMPAHGPTDGHAHGEDHKHAESEGIEWEDDMVEVNRMTTPANMRWKLIDRATGSANSAIDWRFQVGDQVKIRLLNEMDSDHPMHHPFHIHGAGRFLVLSRNGTVEPNLAWKDTVLVRTGQTVDILLDVTNTGLWMAHCHISEHHESGMMFSFHVDPRPE